MDEEDLRQFGTVLEAHLRETVSAFRGRLKSLREGDLSKEPMDEADLASAGYDRHLMTLIQHRNHRLIEEIHGASNRIENGMYGICTRCGEEIALERLKVQPMTTVCIRCKKELEEALL